MFGKIFGKKGYFNQRKLHPLQRESARLVGGRLRDNADFATESFNMMNYDRPLVQARRAYNRMSEAEKLQFTSNKFNRRFMGSNNLLELDGVRFHQHIPRPGKNATKPGAQALIDSVFTHRASTYLGLGLMGVGGMSAFNNARDGRYGRAAVGAGVAAAGYTFYRNPAGAARMAKNLVSKAGGASTKVAGLMQAAGDVARTIRG